MLGYKLWVQEGKTAMSSSFAELQNVTAIMDISV